MFWLARKWYNGLSIFLKVPFLLREERIPAFRLSFSKILHVEKDKEEGGK